MINVKYLSRFINPYIFFISILILGFLFGSGDFGSIINRQWEQEKVERLSNKLNLSIQEDRYKIVKELTLITTAPRVLDIIANSKIPRDGEMHLLTHIVGESLYKQKGVYAIAECFGDQLYGCAHGLIIEAITDEGFEVINSMIAHCKSQSLFQYNMCLHAAGHGFLAYNDYEITPSLHMCDALKEVNEVGLLHCYNGVFMENVHGTHDGLDPSSHPSLSTNNPYAPCDTVSSQYKSACYLNQAGWWMSLYGGDLEKVGDLCQKIPEGYHRECVNNYGRIISTSLKNDVSKIGILCHKLDAELAPYCIYSVVSSLAGIGANQKAVEFCQKEKTIRVKCFEEIINVWEEQNLLSKNNSHICSLLPMENRQLCLD